MDRELLQWADDRLTQIEHHTSDNILYWVIGVILVIVIIVVFIVYYYNGKSTNNDVDMIDNQNDNIIEDEYYDDYTPRYEDEY